MKKTLYFLILSMAILFLFVGCDNKPELKVLPTKKTEPLKIMTTNYLLYTMVESVTGDKNKVDFMFKNEKDQLEFKYTEDSTDNVSKKNIFIYTGGSYEPWVDNFIGDINKSKVTVLNVSRGTKIISRDEPLKYIQNDKEVDVKENPYYWLDVDKYKTALFNISKTIQDMDPINKNYYENNFKTNIKDVEAYDKKLKDTSKKLKNVTFIVQGDELDYFTKYLGLTVIKISNDYINADITNDENKKLETKLSKIDNCVYLFKSDKEKEKNKDLITKYSMKMAKINVYEYKSNYLDLISANSDNLAGLETENSNN